MKALVTGAPGWLGSHLVEALVAEGREVRCFVQRGIDASSLSNLKVELVEGDLRDARLFEVAKDVDSIFHCAGVIHPKNVKEFYEINTKGTKKLIEASIANRVGRFIYISSNSAAGCNKDRNTLMTENDPCKPVTDYGRSKLLAELAVKEAQNKGLDTVIIRPCWYYGPGQPARMTEFMRMIKKGRPLIFGDGYNLRSMSYIGNLVNGLLLAEKSNKASGQTYWIADERPYATLEIVETIAELLGVEVKPRYIPSFVSWGLEKTDIFLGKLGIYSMNIHVAGEMRRDIACSIEKAKRELGYRPKIELKEGMQRAIEWCKSNNIHI